MGNPEPNPVHREKGFSPSPKERDRCRDSMEAILTNESHLGSNTLFIERSIYTSKVGMLYNIKQNSRSELELFQVFYS